MKSLDTLIAELDRRDLFISSLTERLSPSLEWEALCHLKRRDWTTSHFAIGNNVADAIEKALTKFGSECKAVPTLPTADFEDLLG